MSLWLIGLILFGSLLILIMTGIPIAFVMSGIAIVLGLFLWGGTSSLDGFLLASYGMVSQFVYTAVPLYIFMAGILRYSDLVDDMYEAFYRWFGGIKGGLGAGTTVVSTLFAAMVGTSTVATATLGVTARPSMLSRGYDERLTNGIIMASSGLGIVIPPSIIMIIYATVAEVSPGKMFIAGIIPGLLAMIFLIVYCLVYCGIYPSKGPAIPKEDRYTWKEKFSSLKGIILPVFVIAAVILSIFLGVATPTEAAAIGVVGSLVSAAIKKKLTWENLKKMLGMTIGLTAMLFWLVIGAAAYARIVTVTQIGKNIAQFAASLDISPVLILAAILIVFFILGMFIDAGAILFMTAPVFIPLLETLEYDLIWFGVIFIISAIIANLTPPFGLSLFVLKGVAPEINMKELYFSILPFILIYTFLTIVIIIFPQLVSFLPNLMFGN